MRRVLPECRTTRPGLAPCDRTPSIIVTQQAVFVALRRHAPWQTMRHYRIAADRWPR